MKIVQREILFLKRKELVPMQKAPENGNTQNRNKETI